MLFGFWKLIVCLFHYFTVYVKIRCFIILITPSGSTWSPYISSIQFTNPLHFTRLELANSDINNPDSFAAFLASRGRAYVLSEEPLGTPVQGFNDHGCNCYSGGEALNIECLMPGAWRAMVDWLAKVRDPGFSEDVLVLREVGGEELGEGAGEK